MRIDVQLAIASASLLMTHSAGAQFTLVFRDGFNGYAGTIDTRLVESAPGASGGDDSARNHA